MAYNPNNPNTIQEIFSLEGESLSRAGFTETDFSEEPQGFDTNKPAYLNLAGPVLEAYKNYLEIGDRAYEE